MYSVVQLPKSSMKPLFFVEDGGFGSNGKGLSLESHFFYGGL